MDNKPKYLVRPTDSQIFDLDQSNGCYRLWNKPQITYSDGTRASAMLHFTLENLTSGYGFFPIEESEIDKYLKKSEQYLNYINWYNRSDGHGSIKGGSYEKYLAYKAKTNKYKIKQPLEIPINIWDDFYDDGYVPEGGKTESYIYVEDSNISHGKRKECLELLKNYITDNLDVSGVNMWMEFFVSKNKYPELDAEKIGFDRWEIRLENVTHKMLYKWLQDLKHSGLTIDNIPFVIYSES